MESAFTPPPGGGEPSGRMAVDRKFLTDLFRSVGPSAGALVLAVANACSGTGAACLSLEDIAERTGLSRGTVSRLLCDDGLRESGLGRYLERAEMVMSGRARVGYRWSFREPYARLSGALWSPL